MQCPFCGSLHHARDYAPPRTYALMLLGILLILPRNLLSPELFSAIGMAQMGRIFIFGIALLAYGFYDAFRHGNRYCTACGFRFRATHQTSGTASSSRVSERERKVGVPVGKAGASSTGSDPTPLDPNTPIEPLLKCLSFKNEKMRDEAAGTLRVLTGQTFGSDADAWGAWWAENKEAYKARRKQT